MYFLVKDLLVIGHNVPANFRIIKNTHLNLWEFPDCKGSPAEDFFHALPVELTVGIFLEVAVDGVEGDLLLFQVEVQVVA